MKTTELIDLLAAGPIAVPPGETARRHARALAWGTPVVVLLMALFLGLRPDLLEATADPMFWVKLALPASLALGGWFAVLRLSRPGARLGRIPAALLAPALLIIGMAVIVLAPAAPGDRLALLMGRTWSSCLVSIGGLSVPVLAGSLWALRGLAPTSPVLAGAAAGLLAGAVAALVYAFHCPEMAAPFLATWYLLGMLIPAAAGAALGPRLLRW